MLSSAALSSPCPKPPLHRHSGPTMSLHAALEPQVASPFQASLAECPAPALRTWIEMEVDARISQALRGLGNTEMGGFISDDVNKARQEARAVATSQAKLVQVVSGISEELSHLDKRASQSQHQMSELFAAVQDSKSALATWRSETASELRAAGMREKGDTECVRLEAAAVARMRGSLDERVDNLRHEVSNATREWRSWENRQIELVDIAVEQSQSQLNKQLAHLQEEVVDELRDELTFEIRKELQSHYQSVKEVEEQLCAVEAALGARINELGDCILQPSKWGVALSSGSVAPLDIE